MFITKSFKIFRIGPIQVYVDLLWFMALFLFSRIISQYFAASLKSGPSFLPILLAVITIILLYLSLLIHELSHSFVAIKNGIPVRQITLILLGAVAYIEKNPESAGQEFKIAVVGPLANVIIAGLLWGLTRICISTGIVCEPFYLVVNYLIIINIFWAVFNLLPGFPMDGGRILRSTAWAISKNQIKATQIAVWVGRAIAVLMIIGGICVGNFFLILIGFFVFSGGSAELKRLIAQKKSDDKSQE